MDNIYRRDHEMAYISDDAVVAQQKETKKAVREYNEAMPFDPEKGMECLERTGLKHKKTYILSHRSTVSTEAISKSGRIFMPTPTV